MVVRPTTLENALANKGVILAADGHIFRIVPMYGKARIAENRFDEQNNTVLGLALATADYSNVELALAAWEHLKTAPGNRWREDNRVLYDPNG